MVKNEQDGKSEIYKVILRPDGIYFEDKNGKIYPTIFRRFAHGQPTKNKTWDDSTSDQR